MRIYPLCAVPSQRLSCGGMPARRARPTTTPTPPTESSKTLASADRNNAASAKLLLPRFVQWFGLFRLPFAEPIRYTI
jgi:hypothetical protein